MSELKSGDIAKHSGKKIILDNSINVEIIEPYEKLTLVCASGWVKTSKLKLIENKMKYTESNRYKLQQAIKKTGFQAEKLSLASNHAKTYFTGFTAESRFNSRGDITEERLNALLTTLAFAERELLGIGAKTVDDTIPKADEKGSKFVDCSFNPAQNSLGNHCNQMGLSNNPCQVSKSMRNGYPYYSVSNPVKEALDDLHKIQEKQEKELIDEKSENLKKVLIAFLVVVILLALWFLFK